MSACAEPASRVARVTLDPDAGSWAGLLNHHLGARGALSAEARRFREQLGLPTDRPVIMGGHQAELGHPGILAKLLAANALAARTGAAVAWLVVDQDTNHPFRMALPERDGSAAFRVRDWEMGPESPGTPTMSVPAAEPGAAPDFAPAADVGDRVDAAHRAMLAHAEAPSAAAQVTRAGFDLLEDVAPRPIVVYASDLPKTELFQRVLSELIASPGETQERYNGAAAAHRTAGVRALGKNNAGGVELPVWRLDSHGTRVAALHDEIDDTDRVVPRGMLATGMMRLAACDLFVHGTGGRAYERINDGWVPAFAGGAALAPFVTASADVRLVMTDMASAADAERARWVAHHARHQPGVLNDPEAQRARDGLVARIAAAPVSSRERADAFRELHRILAEARDRHAEELGELEREANELASRTDWKLLALDRAWPAALHDPATLAELRGAIDARFG